MASADGSILIRTNVDTTGIRRGTQSIQQGVGKINTSLVKLGTTLLAVFSVSAIINFGKAAVNAASELSNAMIGLKSIVDGTGNSFERANQFIQEYISDGLVPATNAITTYKNLLMRGYSIDQIEQTMIALKDSAAFGRQASLSLGDAVQTASEGLKNENSILVDNAGVTKNVAKMWEDYAKSIGVSTTALTKDQKILAEVNGIMEETRFQTGDAAKVAETWGGKISALNVKWQQFLVLVGGRLIQVLTPVVSFLSNVLTLALKVGEAIANIFGWESSTESITGSTAGNVSDTADSQEDVASATKDTNKALKKQLAFFDDINVLSSETATSGTGTGTGGTSTGSNSSLVPNESQTEQQLTVLEKKMKAFFDGINKLIKPTREALEDLWNNGLSKLANFAGTALIDFYNEFLQPMAKWSFGTEGSGFTRLVDIINKDLSKINWSKLNKSLKDFWSAIEPYAEQFGEGLIDFFEDVSDLAVDIINAFPGVLDSITGALNRGNPEDARDWGKALAELALALVALNTASKASTLLASLGGIAGVFSTFTWSVAFLDGLRMITDLSSQQEELNKLRIPNKDDFANDYQYKSALEEFKKDVDATMGTPENNLMSRTFDITYDENGWNEDLVKIYDGFVEWWDNGIAKYFSEEYWHGLITNMFIGITADVLDNWATFFAWWNENVVPIFSKETWSNIGKSMSDGLKGAFTGIQTFFIVIANGITSIFEGIVNEVIWGINTLIDGMNSLPGVDIKLLEDVSLGRIKLPNVATGNSVPQNSAFQQALTSPFAQSPTTTESMQQNYNAQSSSQPIILQVDGQTFARLTLPTTLSELNRQGYNVAVLEG